MRDPRWGYLRNPCRNCGQRHYGPRGGWAPKACIEALLRAVEDREKEARHAKQQLEQNRRDVIEISDLRIMLRDRDAHIKNLEAQLRPMLVQHEPQTEAML